MDEQSTPQRFGMDTPHGDAAVEALVTRLAGLDFAAALEELPGAVALIASFHPEVRSELVAHVIADRLGLSA